MVYIANCASRNRFLLPSKLYYNFAAARQQLIFGAK